MWPDSSVTSELLGHARGGDAGAVNQLLERHRGALARMVQLRLDPALRARLDASDVVQEVLIKAHRRLGEYLREPAMPFHLWLRQLARDSIVDAHRHHRQTARRSTDREERLSAAYSDCSSLDLAARCRDPGLTPAAAAIREELRRRFTAALGQLEEPDREVVLMRHFEQLSNQEIATALGLSEPAASMRYLRAIRRLRGLLAEAPSRSGVP